MSTQTTAEHTSAPRPGVWIWVSLVVAALAMVATLPGRTHGMGVITEPLLRDLQLNRVDYAGINLWATLIGAFFCIPCGWLIDRLGTRVVLTAIMATLGLVVIVMSQIQGEWAVSFSLAGIDSGWQFTMMLDLFLLVLLTRGLGQSALSVASLTLMGQSVQRSATVSGSGRMAGMGVGVYSFLCAIGFSSAFRIIKYALENWNVGWRSLWFGIGVCVLCSSVPAFLLVRSKLSPRQTATENEISEVDRANSFTLGQALLTPAFWIFALTTSFYGMIAAGISLFNQSILAEKEFGRSVFLTITTITPLIGLASNLGTGWLATRISLSRLLAVAMAILTSALVMFPLVQTLLQVYLYAAALGITGGMITVLFFAVWGRYFGSVHLGKIQGAAQMITVFASALGPLLLALGKEWTNSYVPVYQLAAIFAAILGLCAWFTPQPRLVQTRLTQPAEAAA